MADNQEIVMLSNQPIVVYTTEDGLISLAVKVKNESVWLTKAQMAELFGRDRTVIGRHIVNVYSEGEQVKEITCAKFAHMGKDEDQEYTPEYYNLDVIISVGYRVHSKQFALDVEKHNAQYQPIDVKVYKCSHDRFLLIDNDVYHIGASLKDLGKKLFAFSKMNTLSADELINRIN